MNPYRYPTRRTPNMRNQSYPVSYQEGDRFIGGGFVAPLILGGIAGYALGRPNYYPYPYPYPVYTPYPSYSYNANYYYPYY